MDMDTNKINKIKHLVLCGGGPIGLRILGALERLNERNIWHYDDLETIHGTSIGAIVGSFLCLKYDWDTLNKYIIERPWKDVFKVNAKQIFDSYYNKGLFDSKIIDKIFKPLLEAKDLSLDVTLKELKSYSNIDIYMYTFDLNSFKTVEISHYSHPDMSLIKALNMSCALPGIFMPIIEDEACYIDGGVMCNYPINECLKKGYNANEILGFNTCYSTYINEKVSADSSLLDYIITLTTNATNYICNSVNIIDIENTIHHVMSENPLNMDTIKLTVQSQQVRQEWIEKGKQDADEYLDARNK